MVPVTTAPVRFAFVSVDKCKWAPARFAPVRFAFVSVESDKLAPVRFCPLKSQPVRSLPPECDSVEVLRLIALGRVELGRREAHGRWCYANPGPRHHGSRQVRVRERGQMQGAFVRFAPVRFAFVSVEVVQAALVRFCPLKSQPVRSLRPRSNSVEVFRLIALGRVELGRREATRCGEAKPAPRDDGSRQVRVRERGRIQVGARQVRSRQVRVRERGRNQVGVGEVLSAKVPAREVVDLV